MTMTAASAGHCQNCQSSAGPVSPGGAGPWCPRCEWRLERYDPDRHGDRSGWQWLDRLTYRAASRSALRQYGQLAGQAASGPRWTIARAVLMASAGLLLAAIGGALVLGCFLIALDFPSVTILPGALLVLSAVLLRPRRGGLAPRVRPVTPQEAPTLFGLIEVVAAATGAPVPHVVAVDGTFHARAGAVGLRRRRVLCLGLPMWGTLPAQQRVALLGHQLGHFVNRDVRRGPLAQAAMTTLATVAGGLRPAALRRPLLAVRLTLAWLGLRDTHRAEYLADELAARVAGTRAMVALADTLLLSDALMAAVRRECRAGGDAGVWRVAADRVRAGAAVRLPAQRQLSICDGVSPLATHPPTGLRAGMLRSRPACAPSVLLTEADSARIDSELAAAYETVRRELARP